MPYCPNCGSNVEGRFCAKCGTAIQASGASAAPPPPPAYGTGPAAPPPPPNYGGAPPPPPGYSAAPGYAPPGAAYPQSTGLQENVANTLCYIPFIGWIIAIVFLVIDPYKQNRNIRFNAFQSLFLAAAMFVISLVMSFMWAAVPYGMWGIWLSVFWIVRLAFLAVWLFLMFRAYNNQRFVVPGVGPIAEKQAYS